MKLNNKVYDIFKWLGLAFFPALAILLSTILPVWGVDANLVKALVVTCNGIVRLQLLRKSLKCLKRLMIFTRSRQRMKIL